MTDVTPDRVRALLEAYGADPQRWPADEREEARRLIAADPLLAAEIAAFDTLLDALPAPLPNPALRVALKAIPERARFDWADRLFALWPFGAPWRPAAGLVAAALVGVVVGIATPDPSSADAGSQYAYYYDPISDAAAIASGASLVDFQP